MKSLFWTRKYYLLILILIFIMDACSFSSEASLDSRFIDYFHTTNDVVKQIKPGICNENIDSDYENVTIHLGQTVGDEKTLFLAVDLLFSDIVDINNVILENVRFFMGRIDLEDIAKKEYDEISIASKIDLYTIDIDKSTVSYIIRIFSQNIFISGNELTMMILLKASNTSEQDFNSKPYLISWTPKNTGQIYDISVDNDDGIPVGSATLSAFALNAELFHFSYNTFEELAESVIITKKDNTIITPKSSMSGAYSSVRGYYSISWQFPEILDISKVKSIEIGGNKVNVNVCN